MKGTHVCLSLVLALWLASCGQADPAATDATVASSGSSGTSSTADAGSTAAGSGGTAGSANAAGAGGAIGSAGAGGVTSEAGAGGDGNDAGSGGSGNPGGLTSFELVVIGSSTAAGEGASAESNGWVALLDDAIGQAVATSFSSTNLAVGGYATENLLPASGSDGNIDDAIELEPNLVLVALAGSNDLSAGVSGDTFLERLTAIRDTAVAAGIPVFFLSTAPKDLSAGEREALRDWAQAMGDSFDSCWTPGAENYSPCFVDVFGELANSSLGIRAEYGAGDGIHLNDAGHVAIFEAVEAAITPYVCSMTECF